MSKNKKNDRYILYVYYYDYIMFIMIVYCKMSGLLINENMDDLY